IVKTKEETAGIGRLGRYRRACIRTGMLSKKDEAANNSLPSASLMDLSLALLLPSFASHPSTVIFSPCLSVVRVQPCFESALGPPSSSFHIAAFPLSSFPSTY